MLASCFDLAISYYRKNEKEFPEAKLLSNDREGKFSNIGRFTEKMFEIFHGNNLLLAQPSVCPKGNYSHPHNIQNKKYKLRFISCICSSPQGSNTNWLDFIAQIQNMKALGRDGRVVERAGFENQFIRKGNEGSNPSLSAKLFKEKNRFWSGSPLTPRNPKQI